MRRILPSDAAYPANLHKTPMVPPPALFIRGGLRPCDEAAVAVVGSRHATPYGVRTAEVVAFGLARAGVTVVSGLAVGIDAAAHRGALLAGGRTLAVLGAGLDRVYPPTNVSLADEIAGGFSDEDRAPPRGALLSEYPPGTEASKERFPARNRIVAGLAAAVVVVEAAERSGALITAGWAGDFSRQVFVVPNRFGETNAGGALGLLADGAALFLCVSQVVEEVRRFGAAPVPLGGGEGIPGDDGVAVEGTAGGEAAEPDLPPDLRALRTALSEGEMTSAEAARASRLDAGRAAAGLVELEVYGLVRMLPGGRYVRA